MENLRTSPRNCCMRLKCVRYRRRNDNRYLNVVMNFALRVLPLDVVRSVYIRRVNPSRSIAVDGLQHCVFANSFRISDGSRRQG
jgi:hypothetical protein